MEYDEKLVGTRSVDILKNMMSSDFPTEMTTHSYYWHIQGDEMMLRHKITFSRLKSLLCDGAGSKLLGISHFDDIALYKAT